MIFTMIIKKISPLLFSTFIVVSLGLNSCSSDNDDDNGNGSIGNRRKLSEITLKRDYSDKLYVVPNEEYKYYMDYDSKGRLSKIERKWQSGSESLWETYNIVDIDYDFGLITISNSEKYYDEVYEGRKRYFNFELNDKGYISRLENLTCHYDEDGYLTRVSKEGGIWTFAYDQGDLIKYMLNDLAKEPKIYYVFYGNNFDSGTLVYNVKAPNFHFYIRDDNSVLAIIAYQAGLFGKTAKHISYLSVPSTEKAIISLFDEKNPERYITTKCDFKFK